MMDKLLAKTRSAGYALIAVATVSFGSMSILTRVAYDDGADTVAVLFLRFLISGLVMSAWMVIMGWKWPRGRSLATLIGMGAVGYVSSSYCFFGAIHYASPGLVALLLYLYPVMVVIIGCFTERRWPSLMRTATVGLALGGAAITLWGSLAGKPTGIILGFSAAVIYAVYILVGEHVLASVHPLAAAAVVMLSASAVFGIVALILGPQFPHSARAWGASIAIALISTVVAMVAFFSGMRLLGAADAATLSTIEPVVTFILAAVFLKEAVYPRQIVGGVIILASSGLLVRTESRGEPSKQALKG